VATVVLGIVGNAIAPGAGGVIGAAIGGAIDALVYNKLAALNQPDPPPRPQLERDVRADQGNPAPWILGERTRVPGQVIFAGPLKEIKLAEVTEIDVKTGKDEVVQEVAYIWTMDVAIAFCRNVTYDIDVIWANGTKIYNQFIGTPTPLPLQIYQIYANRERRDLSDASAGYRQTIRFVIDRVNIPPGGTGVRAGDDAEVAGPIPANTGVLPCLRNENWPPNHPSGTPYPQTALTFFLCNESDPGCTPGVGVFPPADPGVYTFLPIVRGPVDNRYTPEVEVYTGEDAQTADPLMGTYLSKVGLSDFQPAYRGTTYVSIRQLNVTKWAGSLPRFEALIRNTAPPPVQSVPVIENVIKQIIHRADSNVGISVDASDAIGDVLGLVILGPVPIVDTLRQLMLYYSLDANETVVANFGSGAATFIPQIKFANKALSAQFVIPDDDRGARESGNDGDFYYQEVVVPDRRDAPSRFVIDYQDITRDYQTSSVTYVAKLGVTPGTRVTKFSTDLNLTPGIALSVLRTLLWTAQQNHDQLRFTLPPNWAAIQTGDRIYWKANNVTLPLEVRITNVDHGQNGLLVCDGVVDDTLHYTQTAVSPLPPATTPGGDTGSSLLTVYDLPPLTAAHAKQFGLYTFSEVHSPYDEDAADYWIRQVGQTPTTALYKSADEGGSWDHIGSQAHAGISGRAFLEEVLGDGVRHVVDTHNTITLELKEGEVLTSADPEDVGAMRANIALIGAEYIGFEIAEQVGGRAYKISCLHRGLRNTESAMATHEVNETFILLTSGTGGIVFTGLHIDDYLRPLEILGVPTGLAIIDAEPYNAIPFTPGAESVKPFSVDARWVRRCEDQSIRVFFQARTRIPWRHFSGTIMPRCETQHCFKLRIFWTGFEAEGGREFIREICCCFGNDDQFYMTYTRAQQSEDFHDTGRITGDWFPRYLDLELSQCSDTIGDGRVNVICLNKSEPSYVQFEMCPSPES